MPVQFRWSSPDARLKSLFVAFGLAGAVVGCDKVPTWNEMTGGAKPAPVPTVTIPATGTPPAQVVNVPPPVPDAGQVLAWFKGLQPMQMNDQVLARLTSIGTGLETITEINANGGAVTDLGLADLARLPALQKLQLDGSPVTDAGMAALQKVPSLQELSLNSTRITDAGLGHLALLPGLKRLELMNCDLTEADFGAIGRLPALEALVLNRTLELNDAGLELICEARTLKSLQLNECVGLTDKGLASLAKVTALEELSLNRGHFTGVGLGAAAAKGGLKSLKLLAVSAVPINLPGARAINSLKTLESLDIGYIMGMNDVFLAEFVEGMKNLKHLNIEASKGVFGQAFTKMKANAPSLETLSAQNTSVTDQGLGLLRGHKKLTFIDLSNTPVTLTGVQQFKMLVPTCKILYAGTRY